MKTTNDTQKLWGGRFTASTAPMVEAFTSSIATDARLVPYDILGSIAHAEMLGACGIIPPEDAATLVEGLRAIGVAFANGTFTLDARYEDVHMNVEAALAREIGPVAGKLHTGRSRNDQVALDLRMWTRDAVAQLQNAVTGLQQALCERAEEHYATVMPGFTHLQYAMPVTVGHHLTAYVEMLERDHARLCDQMPRINVMPLGAAALAGNGFGIDRERVAQKLGFITVSGNSMDTVADRDYCIEFVATCALIAQHLSRLAEDMIIWMSQPYSFITIDDAFCTGSSLMPQKKNPDVLELIRGKTGRVYGHLMSLLTLMKGTPMTYNRDFQEDKPPLFDTADTVLSCVTLFAALLPTVTFNKERLAAAVNDDFLCATDWTEYLVRNGMPFREAHECVGKAVQSALQRSCGLCALPDEEMTALFPVEPTELRALGDAAASVAAKRSAGSTAPEMVRAACVCWRETLSERPDVPLFINEKADIFNT